jgi:hypothetical protein
MARPIPEKDMTAIEAAARRHQGGVTAQRIAADMPVGLPRRTLQYRLKLLVEIGRLIKDGKGRWTVYHLAPIRARGAFNAAPADVRGEGEIVHALARTFRSSRPI